MPHTNYNNDRPNSNKGTIQFNIDLLSKYMLNTHNLTKIINTSIICDSSSKTYQKKRLMNETNVTTESQTGGIFFPPEGDSLFWCFYILKNSQDEYESLGKINIVIEKKIKIEYIERLREGKQVLKTYKTAPLAHIENALLNEKQIDVKTLIALCVIEGISFMYIHKNTYYEMNIDKDESTHIHTIKRMDIPTRYGYEKVTDSNSIRESHYKIDNLNKPLKSMTAYKLDELVVFCTKLGITIEPSKKHKKDLYEMLVQYFSI